MPNRDEYQRRQAQRDKQRPQPCCRRQGNAETSHECDIGGQARGTLGHQYQQQSRNNAPGRFTATTPARRGPTRVGAGSRFDLATIVSAHACASVDPQPQDVDAAAVVSGQYGLSASRNLSVP